MLTILKINLIENLFINITSTFIFFINTIITMLLLTIIIALITLLERKILSLLQRRVGPNHVGHRGRFQYISDALKLLAKRLFVLNLVNKKLYILLPSLLITVSYLGWINLYWSADNFYFDIEFNLMYLILFSSVNAIIIFLSGFLSKNKFAIISSLRVLSLILNTDIVFGLFVANLLLLNSSFSFQYFFKNQEVFWNFLLFFNYLSIFFFIFLMEVGRAPFDLIEAESELVSGYNTEYGGFFFGIYYLSEYLHLFFTSILATIVFFGGNNFYFFTINIYNFKIL